MRSFIKNHLRNLWGWRTSRKIIVFAVDDYGNVRVHSKQARAKMTDLGLKVRSRFDAYDSLEDEEDLLMLFEALSSVKDCNQKYPIWTALTVVANIDFEAVTKKGNTHYHYMTLPQTFERTSGYDGVWPLWMEGVSRGILCPQFHGREHLNVQVFESNLQSDEYTTRINLQNYSYTSIDCGTPNYVSYTAGFDFEDISEIEQQKRILEDGLDLFRQIFGFHSKTFNPPGGRESSLLHPTLRTCGVQYIETPLLKREHLGSGKYRTTINHTGKKNALDQCFLVRNCLFEPTSSLQRDWVGSCIQQIEAAFRLRKPAVISSHRVNFCGRIDPTNRKVGIDALRLLLKQIVDRWPEVEFMTTAQLGDVITRQ